MRSLIILLYLLSFPINAANYVQKIDGLIDSMLPRAHVGVMIIDPQTKEILYTRNSSKFFNPASNIKLLTAAAALYQLGENYHYHTDLYQDKSNFYLKFAGDPSLTSDDLKKIIKNLSDLNIKEIAGDIVLDTNAFKPPYHASGMSYDDLGWYYAAPSTAIMLDGNALSYDFISTKLNTPIEIKPKTQSNALTIINEVKTVKKEEATKHCNLNIEIKANNTAHLYGCLAQNEHPRLMHLAISDPNLYAKNIINQALKESNIILKGSIILGEKPIDAKFIARHESADLSKLISHMLEKSDNLYADSLTKLLGLSLTGQGTYKEGAYAIKKILKERTHIDMHELELTDGAGTRYNAITPNELIIFLTALYNDPKIKPIIINSLPKMGVSGNLKDRMKDTPLTNKVFAKTGSMHDISALSGFMITPTNKTYIFSIISNGINGKLRIGKDLEEKILLAVIGDDEKSS